MFPKRPCRMPKGCGTIALAFWRGYTEEGIAVARCYYDLIYEELKRPWNQPMLFDEHRRPIFGNHYQSVPAAWHLLLGLEGLAWDVPGRTLWIAPICPNPFREAPAFLPGAIAWGGLDYSRVEPDCDQKLVLTLERPFELEFLGRTIPARPRSRRYPERQTSVLFHPGRQRGEHCKVRFTPALHVSKDPLEIRIGGNIR